MRTPPILLLAALGGAVLTQGCAVVGAVGGATTSIGVTAVQDRTMGEGIDDALASNSVKSRLRAVDRNGYAHVDVEVAGGRLLLSGYAPSEEHRSTAELIARSTNGVQEVFNEIQIGGGDTFARSAQDEMITAQIRTRLLASRSVRGVNVNIETHRGVVYLMGVTRTEEELQNAAQIASVVPGVQRVVSLMTVRNPTSVAHAPAQQASAAPY